MSFVVVVVVVVVFRRTNADLSCISEVEHCRVLPSLLTSLAFVAFAKAMPRIKFSNQSTAHHLITCFWVTRECAHHDLDDSAPDD